MADKLKFLLVGCGKIGFRHAIQMQRVGELLAACDIDQQASETFQKEFSVPVLQNVNDLLKNYTEADVVAICTPNGLHAAQTILALDTGFHVICEKPMALTVDDCAAMIAAAEKAGKKLLVVKQNRFNPPVVAVKKLIDNHELGQIFSIQVNCFWNRNEAYYRSTWRGKKDLDGGILFTQFSHFIDIMYYLAGDIKSAAAYKTNLNHKQSIELEDSGVINFLFESGAIGAMNYTVNSFQRNMEGSITIHASNGSVKIGGEYLNTIEYQHLASPTIDLQTTSTIPNDYGTYQGSMSNHDKVYNNLIEVIQQDLPAHATVQDGLKTVEIINKIDSSALWT